MNTSAGPVTRDGAALLRFVVSVVTAAQTSFYASHLDGTGHPDGIGGFSEDPFLLGAGVRKARVPWRDLDWDALAAAGATAEWVSGLRLGFAVDEVLGTVRAVSHGIMPAMQVMLAEKHGMGGWRIGADYAEVSQHHLGWPEPPDVWAQRFLDGRDGLRQAGCLDGDGSWRWWAVAVDWALQITGRYRIPDRTMGRWAAALHWNYEIDSTADQVAVLGRWTGLVGPDDWAWAAAGFTPDETRVLLALPVGHPDRPGPEQLAVMAALRADV